MVKKLKESGLGKAIIEKWNNLNPEEKRRFVLGIAFILVFLGLVGIFAGRGKNTKEVVEVDKTQVRKEEEIDVDLLKKASQLETAKAIEELRLANEQLQKKFEEIEKKAKAMEEKQKEETQKVAGGKEKTDNFVVPPPPPAGYGNVPLPQGTLEAMKKEEEEQELSGIEVVSQKVSTAVEGEKAGSKEEEKEEAKNTKKKYYLPPSFMVATLLSGLDAPAVSKGQGHPVPVLLRINAPAVLPNKVKANLRGCFIIAEGLGNLASERADLRLVSLSCIDKKGRAVIDQKVKGFVVDTDGKIGLRGRVVSKMGGLLARALLTGFISGFGNMISYQSQSVSISPEGTLSTVEPGKAVQYGIGTGIQQAANELLRFYMELARQAIPVIEVLPTRSVTVVISEGVDLVLKDVDF
ncbi:MAG: conjugal transfer pilus assembly protein TraB [Petrotoga sp.]|nr:conjugal transfer pilus assembly protein TraB [Petrotoga sp.]